MPKMDMGERAKSKKKTEKAAKKKAENKGGTENKE